MREAAKQDGRTVLYVSHNMNTIRQLCDRCIVLDKGKVVFEGDVEQAIAIYMGSFDEFPTNYQYIDDDHTKIGNKNIYIKSLSILDKESCCFNVKSLLKCNLICAFGCLQITLVFVLKLIL